MAEKIEVITSDEVVHDLDTCVVHGVDGIAGMLVVPSKRGENLVVPGSHGELHIPAKKHNPANVVLQLWVRGVNPDGTIPADGDARRVFVGNLRALVAMFTVDEQVILRHTLSDGSAREIVGEVTDTIEPDITGWGRWSLGQFAVALTCAHPFWADVDEVTSTVDAGSPAALTEFEGATAPMEDLLIELGPQSNPRLEQPSTGIFVKVNRVIEAGQTITVDTSTWEVYGSPGVAGGLYEDLEYGGRGTARWFALSPEPGGTPVVELTNSDGSGGQVVITGKRKYKIG